MQDWIGLNISMIWSKNRKQVAFPRRPLAFLRQPLAFLRQPLAFLRRTPGISTSSLPCPTRYSLNILTLMRKTLKEVLESWLHSLFGCRWRCNFIRQATRRDHILHGNSVYVGTAFMLERPHRSRSAMCPSHLGWWQWPALASQEPRFRMFDSAQGCKQRMLTKVPFHEPMTSVSSMWCGHVFKFLPLGSCRYSVLATPPWVFHFPLGQPRAPGESNEIHRTYMWTFCMYR